ncbi:MULTISPECIES: metallophosphoesterase family protein [Streptomyces]|uniref:Metallophosphoesterase family protein n=2 Tax=Streptomyces TaxID=1883 RepID=A0ABW7RJ50_9ACTN|nr:metallophosphoesterase [Streptomyces kasugaensis]MYU53520.1 metallophosphoesterase [Streptomyces sp. SID7805]WSK11367.1 metallophosphoesterase [Streptomyces celluloflavus]
MTNPPRSAHLPAEPRLLAVSDLHAAVSDNRQIVAGLRPEHPGDWLLVAGDVAECTPDIERTLTLLADRFETVVWTPGNHELWTHPDDPTQLRGEHRYQHLVAICRGLGIHTPEDPYPVFRGEGGPVRVAPLFLLYDYSWVPSGFATSAEAREFAHSSGLVFTDEFLLHPDPYPTREDWCAARVAATEQRLAEADDPELPLLLVNHYPLVRRPTDVMHHPHLAMWCGTARTADWHLRFHVAGVVYGHLHIPRRTVHDGIPFTEVSVGYPREWRRHGHPHGILRRVLLSPEPAI